MDRRFRLTAGCGSNTSEACGLSQSPGGSRAACPARSTLGTVTKATCLFCSLCSIYEPADVFEPFRAAELRIASSLHDGMNRVAKEFVAARDDEHGVLMLSDFVGVSRELSAALIVNSYDLRSVRPLDRLFACQRRSRVLACG
jgi:Glycosyltransferase family 20